MTPCPGVLVQECKRFIPVRIMRQTSCFINQGGNNESIAGVVYSNAGEQ